MSADLSKSAALRSDAALRSRVESAIVEHAITALGDTSGSFDERSMRHSMAKAVVHDAPSMIDKFLRIIADDQAVSSAATPADVADADLRRVIAAVWTSVAASVPNLAQS